MQHSIFYKDLVENTNPPQGWTWDLTNILQGINFEVDKTFSDLENYLLEGSPLDPNIGPNMIILALRLDMNTVAAEIAWQSDMITKYIVDPNILDGILHSFITTPFCVLHRFISGPNTIWPSKDRKAKQFVLYHIDKFIEAEEKLSPSQWHYMLVEADGITKLLKRSEWLFPLFIPNRSKINPAYVLDREVDARMEYSLQFFENLFGLAGPATLGKITLLQFICKTGNNTQYFLQGPYTNATIDFVTDTEGNVICNYNDAVCDLYALVDASCHHGVWWSHPPKDK